MKRNIISQVKLTVSAYRVMPALALALALSACGNVDRYHFEPLPDGTELVKAGRITIGMAGMDNAPAGTVVHIYTPGAKVDARGNMVPIVSTTPATAVDLNAGIHHLLAIVPPATGGMDNITLGRNPAGEITAELEVVGTRSTSEEISTAVPLPPAPAVLAATATTAVQENASADFDLTPQHITRCVALRVNTQGVTASDIARITATLHGVLHRLPASNGSNSTTASTTTRYSTAIGMTAATTQQWTTTMRLLGTDTATAQLLRIDVEMKSGGITTFDSDATALLATFNTMPAGNTLEVEATINFGIGGLDATITDWTPGWNEGGDGV